MKKHLSLLFALLISACSGPATSITSSVSSEPVISSSEESTTSIADSTSTSSTSVISSTSSISSSSSSSSSRTSSITSTSSTSIPSSTSSSSSSSSSTSSSTFSSSSSSTSNSSSSSSSSSSSQGGDEKLSSLEAFNAFHTDLALKNSTFVVEDYLEEKMISDEILCEHYLGRFTEYYHDEGHFVYLDQGMYDYEIVEGSIEITNCKTLNKDTKITEFFITAYDLCLDADKWSVTNEDFVFTSKSAALGETITVLAGQGIYTEVAKSYSNTLTVAPDGKSATFTSYLITDGYGSYTSTLLVKDLGTTTDPFVEQYLAEAKPLVSTNDFPKDVKDALHAMFGADIPAPNGASYAHDLEIMTLEDQPVDITYNDYLIGDQVASYREALEQYGFTLSDLTDEKGDLKELGYVNWYYEITIDSEYYLVQFFFYPKLYLGEYEQGMFPNGIFTIRFRTYQPQNNQ